MFSKNKNSNKFCDLTDKVAIVTGARRGMGRTHALLLAKHGAKVVVSDISHQDCELVVDEIKKQGGSAIAVKCDVSQKAEVDQMTKKTIETFGKIDILVNNAGICQFKPFLDLTEEEWQKTIDINLKGYFLCAQAVAKEMAKQNPSPGSGQRGVIVNIASIAMGQIGMGFSTLAHYCASKGGIVAMGETLALELAPFNIRVNNIAPGIIDTPMIASVKEDTKTLEGMLAKVPLRRAGKPEEVSNLVLFLVSDESSYMTGSTIVVDGGWSAG
jgi:NAD(P)-dependent dehydrogenase (short-subunit alcohol dehydrogenase family)